MVTPQGEKHPSGQLLRCAQSSRRQIGPSLPYAGKEKKEQPKDEVNKPVKQGKFRKKPVRG